MTRGLVVACCALCLAGMVRAQGGSTARPGVRGIVSDSAGQPIADAELLLHDVRQIARSGEDGRFEFPHLPRGVYVITARRLGYAPVSWSFRLDDTVSLQLRLYRTAVRLPEVVINGEARVSNPKLVGFYERLRSSGASRSSFITRDDIEKRKPWLTSDLFAGKGPRATACLAGRIYVDGAAMPPGSSFAPPRGKRRTVPDPRTPIDVIPPGDIDAMEIYSAATAPAEYNATAAFGSPPGCVILIWTR